MNEQQMMTQQHKTPPIPFMRRIVYAIWCGVIGGLMGLVTSIANGQAEYGAFMGFAIGVVLGAGIGPESVDTLNQYVPITEWLHRRHASLEDGRVEHEEAEVLSLESPPLSTRTSILADPVVDTSRTSVLAPPLVEKQEEQPDDNLFSTETVFNPIPFRRLTVDEIIENSGRNDYQLVVGRTLAKDTTYGRAKRIKFLKKHLKAIGTTQYGKSSLVACALTVIGQTHDPDHVQFAILDLENRTGQLFIGDPHVIRVQKNGRTIPLHAQRETEQERIQEITEYMGYIYTLMVKRYELPMAEQEQLPLLIVYVEEFLVLKDELKGAMIRGTEEEREKAKRTYYTFMHRFIQIARRGLKVRIQFLVCAQLKYRDEDLIEAWGNITDGLAFCVPPTAAQAAGFSQATLLNENAKAKVQGQFVCEIPGLNELILAPDFDLDARLLAIQKPKKTSFIMNVDDEPMPLREVYAQPQQYERVSSSPGYQLPRVQPDPHLLTRLHHACLEHYQPGIGYRQLGELIGVGKDKAGDLLKDLKKWGFIDDDSDE